jgi:hypothetical protein
VKFEKFQNNQVVTILENSITYIDDSISRHYAPTPYLFLIWALPAGFPRGS